MNGYKLVPVEPTQEMVEAAADAYMPFGDMDLALRMAILAAPAVQNKPMSFCEDAALSLAERTFSSEVDEQLAEDAIQYARRLHTLYATPQPAEHQPCPEGIREGAPYDDPAFESLCREHEIWGTPAAAQCAVFWGAGKRAAEQQPAPDVKALVEALTMARETIASALRANAPDYFTTDAAIARHVVIQRIDTALAAHRKWGEK